MRSRFTSSIVGLFVAALGAAGQAAIVQSNTPFPSGTVPVSDTDLIDQSQPTFASSSLDAGSLAFGTVGELNNGVGNFVTASGGGNGSFQATFNLDTSINTLGYDVTSIQTASASAGDSRRIQFYEVFVSIVGSPLFTSLGTYTYDPGNLNDGRITLTDNAGPIATGVDAVRFSFLNTGQTFSTGYSEVDVFGSAIAVVPEPASLGLLSLAALAFTRRRR
jgi:hypothetical protein